MKDNSIKKINSSWGETTSDRSKIKKLSPYEGESNCFNKEKKLQKTLRELENIKFAIDKSAIVAIVDPKGKINYVNDIFCEISGYTRQELIGENHRLLNSGYHPREFFENMWLTITSGKVWKGEIRDRAKNGKNYWVNTTIVPFLDEEQKPWQYLSIQFEITDRKEVEAALIESKARYENLVNLSPVGIFRSDRHGQFLEVNDRWCEMSGMTAEEAMGQGWSRTIHPEEREQVVAQWYLATWKKLPFKSKEYRLQRPDGVIIWVFAQAVTETNADGKVIGYVGTITDISDRKQAEEKLRFHAWHDALTGLPNRGFFLQRLQSALTETNNCDKLFAVLFLDLNRFKVINDSLGHLVGDRLLCEVANRLQEVVRGEDIVARLGGDEFTILLKGVTSLKNVLEVANRIKNKLAQPIYLEENLVFTGASIGIVLCGSQQQATPPTQDNLHPHPHCVLPNPITFHEKPEEILRAADTAMYRAKELGGTNRYVVFNPQMYEQALALLHLENDLRRAVKTCEEFVLYYQPIFSNQTGKITSFEALVRWQHPTRGLISPSEFISLAEETGLIIPLGRYILSRSILQLRIWQAYCQQDLALTMTVNISPKQLSHENFLGQIDEVLQATGADGKFLNFEITESTLMENPKAVAQVLSQLRKREISVSIDDFGTGYSSLSQLSKFSFNTLKIDRSFVMKIGEGGENISSISTMVTLAHNLGLDVVAEGVETKLQLEQLKKLGCEGAQGYFFSRPLEAERATYFLVAALEKYQENSGGGTDSDRQNLPNGEKSIERPQAGQIKNDLDFHTILKTKFKEIRNFMQVDCCQFFWYRNDMNSGLSAHEAKVQKHHPPVFEPIHSAGNFPDFGNSCLGDYPPAITILEGSLIEKNLLRIDDIAGDSNIDRSQRDLLLSKGLKSLLAVVVRPKYAPGGVVVCERSDRQQSWLDEEVEFIEELAEQLAIALDYAKLHEQSHLAAVQARAKAEKMQQAIAKLQQTQAELIQAID